jgi:addiction module HigA family antidote
VPASGLTPAQAARRLRVSRQALHPVLSGKTGLSPDMAVRVSRLLGGKPNHWLAIQASYDLWHVARAGGDEFAKIGKRAWPHG